MEANLFVTLFLTLLAIRCLYEVVVCILRLIKMVFVSTNYSLRDVAINLSAAVLVGLPSVVMLVVM